MGEEERRILTSEAPIASLEEYRRRGGGQALEKVLQTDPADVIEIIRKAGLRGRGGGGFPTAVKWDGVRRSEASRKFVCANGAEGEPGTFKDRYLMRQNPYQIVEGLAIAALVIGAEMAYLAVKRHMTREIGALQRALDEFQAGTEVARKIDLVLGPDEYLFGEEKALLEVIEGGQPLPRLLPPYLQGLFGGALGGPESNPTVVNNIETLAHVPQIILKGPDWFRSFGTQDTPGTMIFTISGDVQKPIVRESPLGVTLRELIYDLAGGLKEGRRVKAIFSGVANAVVTPEMLDLPLSFDSMKQAGSGLGSAGFIVYDDTACMVDVAYWFSRFLHVESCNQCPPCKMGSREITTHLRRLLDGEGNRGDLEDIPYVASWTPNGARCFLAWEESIVVTSILREYPEDFAAHIEGTCLLRHDLQLPKMTDFLQDEGFTYDQTYHRKQPDWSYSDDPVVI
ncbi:MAG: NADH-ubiquinone oxidoreductase-F iron-sulfur binding region domain-containing protein [Armatimonadota bacterium]|nr:NADH-ubiquinone oxidoreductase-F iron-sulfur binding region domain-containing protein [Armatimonadota bacterium]